MKGYGYKCVVWKCICGAYENSNELHVRAHPNSLIRQSLKGCGMFRQDLVHVSALIMWRPW